MSLKSFQQNLKIRLGHRAGSGWVSGALCASPKRPPLRVNSALGEGLPIACGLLGREIDANDAALSKRHRDYVWLMFKQFAGDNIAPVVPDTNCRLTSNVLVKLHHPLSSRSRERALALGRHWLETWHSQT